MNRRDALRIVACSGLAILAPRIAAQPVGKPTVIGLLDAGERREWWDALRQQLRELGYVEGRGVVYEGRYAKGELDALPAMAKELVALDVAVIVTSGAAAAMAAQRATSKVPIVMATGADQVGLGLVGNLAHPGGNVTGVSSLNPDLMAKRLELLREIAPRSSRVAALWHRDNPASMASVRELDTSAARMRIALQSIGIRSANELPDAFSAMTKGRIEAIIVVGGPLMFAERKRIAELANKQRLPAMYSATEYAEAGGLMSYAPSYRDLFRRAGVFVNRILKGANPAELPIEQPTTFELVINSITARELGIVIPPAMLARADRVIR